MELESCQRTAHNNRLISLALVLAAFIAAMSMILPPMAGAAEQAQDSKNDSVSGAGATFPALVYSKWAENYEKSKKIKISYKGIGSGGGIAQIKAETVDFGGTDRPLKKEDLEKHGLEQFPMLVGGIVPVINVSNVPRGGLKLTPELLVDILLGKIPEWNHRRIKAVNPDLRLPDETVTVVHRADGSGSTWIFTTYLGKVSEAWREKVGSGKAVSWPTGVGAKGNPGVSKRVKEIRGSIGYVEFAYALKNGLNFVKLQNRDGEFVRPTIRTFQAAAANADWEHAPGFYMDLTDQPGKETWPITGATYILVHKEQKDKEKALNMLNFFDWCYKQGASMAKRMHYVPIPKQVFGLVEKSWKEGIVSDGEPVWK